MNLLHTRKGFKASRSLAAGGLGVIDYKLMELPADQGFTSTQRFFHANVPFDAKGVKYNLKRAKEGDADSPIIDVTDVSLQGYGSTWNNLDRDGEMFVKGCFTESIPDFMKNPVMLKDHWNSCDRLVGSFNELREDGKGLFVKGTLSNSPAVAHIRWLVAEGHLKTFSVAGLFQFDETHTRILKVYLWEISLIPIPANPKAIFEAISSNPVYAKGLDDDSERNPLHAGSRDGQEVKKPKRPSGEGLIIAGLRVTS